jgi:hypothetical protein
MDKSVQAPEGVLGQVPYSKVNALDLIPTLTVVIAGVNGMSGRQISETGYMRIAPGDIGRQLELEEQRRLAEQRWQEDSQPDSVGEWYQGKPIQDIVFEGLHSIKTSELDGVLEPFIGVTSVKVWGPGNK